MFTLETESLRASVLDPVGDRDKLGSRYCAGGYVWQVEDKARGPLLAGPCYPGPSNGFDGQGMPDVFEIAMGQNRVAIGDEVTVMGVGRVKRTSPVQPFHVRDNPQVLAFAAWEVESKGDEASFRTRQEHGEEAWEIIRRIVLRERSLWVHTEVEHLRGMRLPLRWFAHPFFPWAPSGRVWKLDVEASLPPNDYWNLDRDGWIGLKDKADKPGSFLPLQLPFGYPLRIIQAHPLLGTVTIHCDFPVAWLPIWANAWTASCEPYFHTVLETGGKTRWSIAYHF